MNIELRKRAHRIGGKIDSRLPTYIPQYFISHPWILTVWMVWMLVDLSLDLLDYLFLFPGTSFLGAQIDPDN
jgi:hypothetical protein